MARCSRTRWTNEGEEHRTLAWWPYDKEHLLRHRLYRYGYTEPLGEDLRQQEAGCCQLVSSALESSLEPIERAAPASSVSIVDVGGGEFTLVMICLRVDIGKSLS